jgi:2-polyprenyl-3-methyl-5-hydroxy-6-metoxy-1,4-benzoquinol methylase
MNLTSSSSQPLPPLERTASGKKIQHLSNTKVYNAWASVYDNDGNVLQAIDDLELSTRRPEFLPLAASSFEDKKDEDIQIIDLGCGTGRNTVKLLTHPWADKTKVRVTGIDASEAMVSLARQKVHGLQSRVKCDFMIHNFLDPTNANGHIIPLPTADTGVDAIISTLVLEHFPLPAFFQSLRSLIKPNGVALITNMHSEMGSLSQAGFISQDKDGNEVKVRGSSYAHGVRDTVDAAVNEGFEVVGEVWERAVEDGMVGREVSKRGEKWVGVKVWYGFIVRRVK